jgi:hypothetical protein
MATGALNDMPRREDLMKSKALLMTAAICCLIFCAAANSQSQTATTSTAAILKRLQRLGIMDTNGPSSYIPEAPAGARVDTYEEKLVDSGAQVGVFKTWVQDFDEDNLLIEKVRNLPDGEVQTFSWVLPRDFSQTLYSPGPLSNQLS